MHYKVVFDITQTIPEWRFPAFGLIFVAIGILLVLLRRMGVKKIGKLFPRIYIGFALLWTTYAAWSVFTDYYTARSAFELGKNEVVEGKIENFHPMPATGHVDESFTVGGKKFSYSDYGITPGFRNAKSLGGPIRAGLHVRICYVGNDIVRLEVEE